MRLEKYTKAGQIQVGDLILASDGKEVIHARVTMIVNEDTDPEIVLKPKLNHYFISSMYFSGKSWIKEVYIVRTTEVSE